MQGISLGATTFRKLQPSVPLASRGRGFWRDLAAPLTVALAVRLLLLVVAPTEPTWDGVIYVRAAEQLARGEGYTLRILAEDNPAHPTAFYPVGFPALLALVRLLGGGLLADGVLQAFCCTALVPIAYLFARRAQSRRAGRWAAWLSALWPGGIFLSSTWLAEPAFALGAGIALLPLAYARRRARPRALVIAALGLGAVAYLRASALPMVGCLGLALGYGWPRGRPIAKRALAGAALAVALVAIACLPLAPWAQRNAKLLGAPVLVSTNGGVNLLLGARGDGNYASVGPHEYCKTAPLREVQRNACYQRQALALIASDPLGFGARALLKLAHTFGHDSAPAQCFSEGLTSLAAGPRETLRLWALGLCRVSWLFILAAALAGGRAVLTRAPVVMRAVLLTPIAALAGLHMVYLGGDRYHAAVAPMVMALAGIALARPRASAPALRRSDAPSQERPVFADDAPSRS